MSLLVVLRMVCLGLSADTRYRIEGNTVVTGDSELDLTGSTVSLSGSTLPLYKRVQVDRDGKFSFKNLRPGSYTLILRVDGVESARRNIEVGSALADSRGRIPVQLEVTNSRRPPGFNVTSVRRLSMPEKATQEYQKGLKLLENGKVQQAKKAFQKTLEIAPQHLSARNRLATIAYQEGDLQVAEQQYRTILDERPSYFAALINLGGVLAALGRNEESLAINLRAQQERPDEPLVQAQLGYCYFSLGQYEKAEQHLSRTKELEPGHFSQVELLLADIYWQRDDLEGVVRELEEFLYRHPDSDRAERVRLSLEKVKNRRQQQ